MQFMYQTLKFPLMRIEALRVAYYEIPVYSHVLPDYQNNLHIDKL